VRRGRDQVRAFPSLFLAPRTVFPSMAITSRPPARTARVHSQAPRTRSRTSGLTRAKARRNVDSSAAPRTAPSTASTSGPRQRPAARSRRTTAGGRPSWRAMASVRTFNLGAR
jgi:hypothetical protein